MFVCQSDGKQDTIQYEKEEADRGGGVCDNFPTPSEEEEEELDEKIA